MSVHYVASSLLGNHRAPDSVMSSPEKERGCKTVELALLCHRWGEEKKLRLKCKYFQMKPYSVFGQSNDDLLL